MKMVSTRQKGNILVTELYISIIRNKNLKWKETKILLG
jgi:hypothetical protein